MFIHNWNEPYLPLPSQLWLVLFTDPGGMEGWVDFWCEVAPAKIRTCNLVITNLAFYHTATSAWLHRWYCCAGHAGVMGTAAAELQHFQVGAEEEPAGSARRSQLLRLVVQTEPRVQVHESLGRLSDWKWVSCWFMLWLVTSNLMM